MLSSNGAVTLPNNCLYFVSMGMIFVVCIGLGCVLLSAISVNDWLADKVNGWEREETNASN